MRIYYGNQIDPSGITMSSSTVSSDSSASYAANPFRTVRWKTGTTTASEWLGVQITTVPTITGCCIIDHNLTAGDTVWINASNTAGFPLGTLLLHQAIPITTTGIVEASFTGVAAQYWELNITKPSAGVQRYVGAWFLGSYYDTPEQPDFDGYTEEYVDPSRITKSLGGQTYSEQLSKYSTLKTKFSYIDQTFIDNLATVYSSVGSTRPVVVRVDSTGSLAKLWYARISKNVQRQVTGYDGSLKYNASMEFEELV